MLAYARASFRDYALLPVFPLRTFRHKSIFIRTDRGIEKPEDLGGKKIGTPGYSSTSLTWIRGLLEEEYGVKPTDVEWVVSSADSAARDTGSPSEFESTIPDSLSVSRGPGGVDESDLLAEGHVDALFHAAKPRAVVEGHPDVGTLFPDPRATEQDYYARTGIFPIMHAVAIQRAALEEHPWLAKAVFDGYAKAKRLTYAQMAGVRSLLDTLPWYAEELEATRTLMGPDFYSYGMTKANRKTLETFFRYSHQQGFTERQLTIEDLFEPTSLDFVEA
jgi:4,5-dihydroxyphthalate decarboxylase